MKYDLVHFLREIFLNELLYCIDFFLIHASLHFIFLGLFLEYESTFPHVFSVFYLQEKRQCFGNTYSFLQAGPQGCTHEHIYPPHSHKRPPQHTPFILKLLMSSLSIHSLISVKNLSLNPANISSLVNKFLSLCTMNSLLTKYTFKHSPQANT